MSVMGALRTIVTGARGYRFEGEQENHADQMTQTQTSIGLMAATATQTDDDSLRQALQTEHTLRARLAVLDARRRVRGLTLEEGYERASIIKGLRDIGTPATLHALGDIPLSAFGPVGQRRSFLPGVSLAAPWLAMVRPWMLWAGAIGLSMAWGGVQTARLNHAKDDLRETRAHLEATTRTLAEARAVSEQLAEGMQQADAQTRETAELIERERRRRVAAERESRRIRDAMDQARVGGPVDYGFGGVRDPGEVSPGASDSNATGDNPG